MAYLELSPAITALRARPEEFEFSHDTLHHLGSQHSFAFSTRRASRFMHSITFQDMRRAGNHAVLHSIFSRISTRTPDTGGSSVSFSPSQVTVHPQNVCDGSETPTGSLTCSKEPSSSCLSASAQVAGIEASFA